MVLLVKIQLFPSWQLCLLPSISFIVSSTSEIFVLVQPHFCAILGSEKIALNKFSTQSETANGILTLKEMVQTTIWNFWHLSHHL